MQVSRNSCTSLKKSNPTDEQIVANAESCLTLVSSRMSCDALKSESMRGKTVFAAFNAAESRFGKQLTDLPYAI